MRLTRRGWAVVLAAVAAVVLGALYGARALNAVATPALVALFAGAGQVWLADTPAVTRNEPPPGFPGETRTVHLDLEVGGPCTVRDAIPPGLALVRAGREGDTDQVDPDKVGTDRVGGVSTVELAGDGSVEYGIELRDRGEHTLGPVTVTVKDVFGLVAREFETGDVATVLVYPEVHTVAGERTFAGLVEQAGTAEREAFDRLREYTPGDALRDIDWKSSAKRTDEEFVVTEFAAPDEGEVTIVAESGTGHADEMATAAASVALYLLDARIDVELVLPTGRIEPGSGDRTRGHEDQHKRERVLAGLARTRAGPVGGRERERADVSVTADVQGAYVSVEGHEVPFEALVDPPATRAGVIAG